MSDLSEAIRRLRDVVNLVEIQCANCRGKGYLDDDWYYRPCTHCGGLRVHLPDAQRADVAVVLSELDRLTALVGERKLNDDGSADRAEAVERR